jgi:hypothetical protein
MIRQSVPFQMPMVAKSCVGVSLVTIRSQVAQIAEWQDPVVRVHLISPWRAHLGDHAGHCIHHQRQQATDYLFRCPDCTCGLYLAGPNLRSALRTRPDLASTPEGLPEQTT